MQWATPKIERALNTFYHLFDLRSRPRIRTAEYWWEYYARKQREWRAAHPRIRTGENTNHRAKDGCASKSVTARSYEHALRHQPKRASSTVFEISSKTRSRHTVKRDG